MASRIEIARGSLSAFLGNGQALVPGELFWQAKNDSANAETGFKDIASRPWDEGTLYIGNPHLFEDDNHRPIAEGPLPIAGTRTFKSLVYKGLLTTQKDIFLPNGTIGDTFLYVRTGDFYIFANDAEEGGAFKSVADFRKNDILLITNADFDMATGLSSNIQYTKIDCSGGDAYQTRFNNENTNFVADNVQDALTELEYEKLSYRGVLSTQIEVTGLQPEIGTLWLIVTDGLQFDIKTEGYGLTRPTKKGDFAYYINDQYGWRLIPSGYTDSEDIDFDSTAAVEMQQAINSNDTTFDARHIYETKNLTNVKAVLDFVLSNKAQLDASGKVPLSQLHDTVLGNLQYCGVWNPLAHDDLNGTADPDYQNNWPQGRDTDGSGEDGDPIAPHNGDYYIVQTSGTNVQYHDKTSYDQTTGTYERILELNSGDWIVFSKSPVSDASVVAGSKIDYHWSVIDNSDRITALNFIINGEHSKQEALPAPAETVSRIGTPTIAASDKLVLWDNGGTITVAGVRLVSQKFDENGKATYIPRYTAEKNELENSTILNYKDDDKGELTLFHSNVSVGDSAHTFETEVHGNISIFPHLEATKTGYTDTQIKFFQAVDNTLTTDLRELDLRVNPNYYPGSVVYLPEYSATLIGKLKGVDLISGRITKSTQNGFIDNTSIEEHVRANSEHLTDESGNQYYSDDDVDSVEIHAPTLTVNNAEIRHITFGQKRPLFKNDNGDDDPISGSNDRFVDGHLPTEEYRANLYANEYQIGNIEVYLPSRSGTLLTDTDFNDQIKGTEKRLPVFGPELTVDGKKRSTLIDSNIRQTANALFNSMMRTASVKSDADVEYLETYKKRQLEDGSFEEEDSIVESDLVIGKLSEGEEGELYVESTRNLLVTGDQIFANPQANNVFIHSERLFNSDSQYRNPYTEELNDLTDVHVDLPAVSGVLLTSNSRIDGGIWQ